MTECRFWWASVDGAEPEVVHVTEIALDYRVAHTTGNDCDIDLDKVRLIERVLPAGRAAAAVEKLDEAINGPHAYGPWRLTQEAIDILQGEEAAGV